MKIHVAKGVFAGEEMYRGAFLLGRTHFFERLHAFTQMKFHLVFFAISMDSQFEPIRQCIDHRYAHAVQTAGDFVAVLIEFTTGMQLSHDDLCRTATKLIIFVNVGRNTTTIIRDRYRVIWMNGDNDVVAVAGKCLVNCVIQNFKHHMV